MFAKAFGFCRLSSLDSQVLQYTFNGRLRNPKGGPRLSTTEEKDSCRKLPFGMQIQGLSTEECKKGLTRQKPGKGPICDMKRKKWIGLMQSFALNRNRQPRTQSLQRREYRSVTELYAEHSLQSGCRGPRVKGKGKDNVSPH